jgi:hypothetical protein
MLVYAKLVRANKKARLGFRRAWSISKNCSVGRRTPMELVMVEMGVPVHEDPV